MTAGSVSEPKSVAFTSKAVSEGPRGRTNYILGLPKFSVRRGS